MSGIAAFGLWFLAWAPNHQLLWASIDAADVLEHRLVPWREIAQPALPLWIAWHDRPQLGGALFISDEDWQAAQALWLVGSERLLPSLYVPRLLVSAQHFRAESGSFKKIENLHLDSVERLLNALLDAHFDRLTRNDPHFERRFRERAEALMSEVPEGFRLEAYRNALVEFGSHLLSIGHEIGRHQRRRQAKGESLCAAIGHPASLFGIWRKAIEEGEYRGYQPAGENAVRSGRLRSPSSGWAQTRASLSREDKNWLLALLGFARSGDPGRDFGFLCEG